MGKIIGKAVDIFSEFERGLPETKKSIWRRTEENILTGRMTAADLDITLYILDQTFPFIKSREEQNEVFARLKAAALDPKGESRSRITALNIFHHHGLLFSPEQVARIYDLYWRIYSDPREELAVRKFAGSGLLYFHSSWLAGEKSSPPADRPLDEFLHRQAALVSPHPELREGGGRAAEWEKELELGKPERATAVLLLSLLDWYPKPENRAARLYEILREIKENAGEFAFFPLLGKRLERIIKG